MRLGFSSRELATILAALRERQARLEAQDGLDADQASLMSRPEFDDIATEGDSFDALSIEEIDNLCEGLNR